MAKTEAELKAELERFERLVAEARVAVSSVLDLLEKAEERYRKEGGRRWGRIRDNIERALDLTKSRLNAYEQKSLAVKRQISGSPGATLPSAGTTAEADWEQSALDEMAEAEVLLPKNYLEVAERILAMPMEALQSLTLDQVAAMNAGFFEEGEAEIPSVPVKTDEVKKKSSLDERIERARQAKLARQSSSHRRGTSFSDQRKQKTLREAVGKVMKGEMKLLTAEEAEAVLSCYRMIVGRTEPTASDLRLRGALDPWMDDVRERLADIHRKELQSQRNRPRA